MAMSQNVGTMISALTPALFATVAPPGSNVPLIVGSITFAIAVVTSLAALSARETYRLRLHELGDPHAVPMAKAQYDLLRAASMADAGDRPTEPAER
jgi:hypothetical protein